MKKVSIVFQVLVMVSASFAVAQSSGDQQISNFLKGNICQRVDMQYPGKLPTANGKPGWYNCREEGNFSRISDYYGLTMRTDDGSLLSCSARVQAAKNNAHTPKIVVKCQTSVIKNK